MSEEYRTITTTFRRISPSGKAIMVDRPPGQGHDWAIIPRSLLHGGDDLEVERFAAGQAISIRVMAWKAEELGWRDRRPPLDVTAPLKVTLKQGRLL